MRRIIYLATVALIIGLYVLPTHSFLPVRQAHANPTIWFISYMDKDTGNAGLPYTYTFSWGDTQVQTITITANWGDTLSDQITSTGKCCDPPGAYSTSPTLGHVYAKTGVYLLAITLYDSTGASSSRTLTISISDPYVAPGPGGVGGKPTLPM